MVDTVYIEDIEKEFYKEISNRVSFTKLTCRSIDTYGKNQVKINRCLFLSESVDNRCNLFNIKLFHKQEDKEEIFLRCSECISYF